MEYQDKLLEEKIKSMKQLDRIEFNNLRGITSNFGLNVLNTLSIYFCGGVILSLLGGFLILLNSTRLNIWGIGTILIGFLFIAFSIILFFSIKKFAKEVDEETENFIEERTKK